MNATFVKISIGLLASAMNSAIVEVVVFLIFFICFEGKELEVGGPLDGITISFQ